MQFLSGLGRYFETPQAYEDGERFDITGVDNNYQAPVAGVGRYFEDSYGVEHDERFDIAGANRNYQAPIAGVGRYFEDAYGIEHGERFDIAGANKNYQAPLVGGVGRYMLDDTAFKGVGAIPQTTVAQLQKEGLLGVSGYRETLESANPYLLIGAGVALGALITYAAHRMKK